MDYIGRSSVISIIAGQTVVTYPVDTLPDNFLEDDEYFKATLSLPTTGPVVLGPSRMAFVTITDGNGKLSHIEFTSLCKILHLMVFVCVLQYPYYPEPLYYI